MDTTVRVPRPTLVKEGSHGSGLSLEAGQTSGYRVEGTPTGV